MGMHLRLMLPRSAKAPPVDAVGREGGGPLPTHTDSSRINGKRRDAMPGVPFLP